MYEKDPLPIYIIPKDIKDSIEKDIVPGVLNKPLSPSTYTDYFAALLYAEDHYIEKWSDFQLKNVTLELQEAEIYRKFSNKKHFHESDEKKVKLVAAFEIDSVPGRRPYLLSRDFVFAKPTGRTLIHFRGNNAKTPEYFEDLFCNLECYEEYRIRTSGRYLRQELFQIEHGEEVAPKVASQKNFHEKLVNDPTEGNADHIIPVYRGGAIFSLKPADTEPILSHKTPPYHNSISLIIKLNKKFKLWWINYLQPDIKRGNFSKEEEDTIIKLHHILGNSDIWSLGMVVLECAIGRFPYMQSEDQQSWPSFYELLEAIVESPPPTAPADQFSPEFCSFVSAW
ncbi:hypothetical protein Q3G72_030787 [Acer saccharum]|nr:hypothetical protein Q3G72_030787 [Acer saccharum]